MFLREITGFVNIKLINSDRQPTELKELLTTVQFRQLRSNSSKMPRLAMQMLRFIVTIERYTFRNANKTLTLKTPMFCNSFNVIYVVICSGCLEEYIGKTGVG